VGPAISEVLPYAVGVAVSPIPLAAVILMLFSARARANGSAFLLGWVVGLAILVAAVYALADTADVATNGSAGDGASTGRVVLGVALLAGGIRRLRRARPADGEVATPRWMAGIDACTPVKAAGLGVLLSSVNPKNLALAAAAALGVAQLGASTSDAVVGLVVFVVVASIPTATAVAYRALGGERSRVRLDEWRAWLVSHNDAVTAALFLVFGAVLLAKGLGLLTA
jgi:hypothetical protein